MTSGVVFSLSLFLAAWVILSAQPAKIETSTKAIVAAAARYVDTYNPQMQNVLADEVAVQRVIGHDGSETATRITRADFFLTYVPADTTWIAVRDVRDVDGEAVDDPNNIRVMMDRAPLWRMGSVIAGKNSRFNIGNITRTFNEPTLALLIVTKKHRDRFKFNVGAVSPGAAPSVTLRFKEEDKPPLVAGTNGAPAFSSGEMIVDAASGRIERTRVQFVLGTITARIETTYAENPELKLWVPSVMREAYTESAKGFEQTIRCVSTYTNYRKFETSAIIK